MVTMLEPWTNGQGRYAGLSTDEKPTDARNGDVFFEMDTSKIYWFSKGDGKWYEQNGGGSGGGSADIVVGKAVVGNAQVG